MTEIFDGLSVMDKSESDEDHVVYLLASLPASYSVLVTALKANLEVPALEVVMKRLLHKERKLKERIISSTTFTETGGDKAIFSNDPKGRVQNATIVEDSAISNETAVIMKENFTQIPKSRRKGR